MAFEITYRRNGKDFEAATNTGSDREAAISEAGAKLLALKADGARIKDLDGSTAEVCSIRPDGNGGYTRDDKP